MKLEYLAAGSSDCPLLRLYEFTPAEAAQLQAAVAMLASGAAERFEVHALPFVQPVAGCRLVFVRRWWDQGIIRTAEPAAFQCGFTAGTWDNVAGLLAPFTVDAGGFQWLAGTPGGGGAVAFSFRAVVDASRAPRGIMGGIFRDTRRTECRDNGAD